MQADNDQARSDEGSLGATYASELLRVATYDIEKGRVVSLTGELDASTCSNLAEHLVGPPGDLIVVDLSRLRFIDSSGLGVLHEAWRRAIADDGNLIVCRPCPLVERVLEITGLDIWIEDWNPRWSKALSMAPMSQCHLGSIPVNNGFEVSQNACVLKGSTQQPRRTLLMVASNRGFVEVFRSRVVRSG